MSNMAGSFLLLALGLACVTAQIEPRLTEKPIDLVGDQLLTSNGYKPRHLAGYFTLNRTYAAKMFYFFFEHRKEAEGPLILWMQGGPGCSSELAVFYENGPYHINDNLTTCTNPYGWDVAGSIIYVDQPINTGFSFSDDERDRVYDEKVVAADMIDFFEAFLEAHPEFKGRDLYITGESYGGHYVPVVSYAILKHNLVRNSTDLNLKGLAIGNGLTDSAIQYGAYADFAYLHKLIPKQARKAMKTIFPICKYAIDACNSFDLDLICRGAVQICQVTEFTPIFAFAGNINVYDIRKPTSYGVLQCVGQLCYDFSKLNDYLNQPEVQKQLGVEDRKWSDCNFDVENDLEGDEMRNYADLIPPLLEAEVSVMIYVGVQDLICNWIGNERWLEQLAWSNATDFSSAKERIWTVEKDDAGSVRSAGKLSFVKIDNAGHLSPMDQPKNTLDMISHFVNGTSLHARSAAAQIEERVLQLPHSNANPRVSRFIEAS